MHIFLMILLISVLIIVHELGHFLAARFFKIKVEKFAIGLPFGPTLYKKQMGETTFLIHACLFGGYISFPDDEKDNTLPKDSPELFNNKPTYQKIIVVSAGVIANILCALVLVCFTAFAWGKLPLGETAIYFQNINAPEKSSVYQAGFQQGDKYLTINNIAITSFYELKRIAQYSRTNDGKTTNKNIALNLKEIYKLNNLKENFKKGDKIFLPQPIAEAMLTVTKNQLIGLDRMPEDEIQLTEKQISLRDRIQGEKFFITDQDISAKEIATAISDTYKPIYITVLRNNEEVKLNPVIADKNGIMGVENQIEELYTPTTNIKSGIINSYKYLKTNTQYMLMGLGSIFTGKVPLKDMHGIVAITKIGGNVIEHQGIYKGLLLTAIISLNLAIINFLPFPALDGGHVFFMTLEKITGRKISEETLEKISSIGFYFLLFLMVIILFNDIWALITKSI